MPKGSNCGNGLIWSNTWKADWWSKVLQALVTVAQKCHIIYLCRQYTVCVIHRKSTKSLPHVQSNKWMSQVKKQAIQLNMHGYIRIKYFPSHLAYRAALISHLFSPQPSSRLHCLYHNTSHWSCTQYPTNTNHMDPPLMTDSPLDRCSFSRSSVASSVWNLGLKARGCVSRRAGMTCK